MIADRRAVVGRFGTGVEKAYVSAVFEHFALRTRYIKYLMYKGFNEQLDTLGLTFVSERPASGNRS